jgi:hypothetical protein
MFSTLNSIENRTATTSTTNKFSVILSFVCETGGVNNNCFIRKRRDYLVKRTKCECMNIEIRYGSSSGGPPTFDWARG